MNPMKKSEMTPSDTAIIDLAGNRVIATRLVAGVAVPDTPLIARAIEHARERSEPYLFNHVMRSWLFAVSLARQRQIAHDGEVLAVATLLHDLGLAKSFGGDLRFLSCRGNTAASLDIHECEVSAVCSGSR